MSAMCLMKSLMIDMPASRLTVPPLADSRMLREGHPHTSVEAVNVIFVLACALDQTGRT